MTEAHGYYKGNLKMKLSSNDAPPKEKVEDILKYPFTENAERGIRKATAERFGIRAALSETDGKTVEAYYFPSYNQKGKITGFKKQDVTKTKDEKGHWTTVGTVSINNKLFGQDVAESVPRKKNNLVTTEGEWDTVSVYQAQVDSVAGTKFAGMEPFVVSITMGTANAVESILHNESFVKSFQEVTLFMDDDYATPAETKKGIMKGHEARDAIANALLGSGISLHTVNPGTGFKDASDYLQAGKSSELAKLVQFERASYNAEKIVKASSISFEDLITAQVEGVYVNCFPKLMKRLNGFRLNELTLCLAPSGAGKTSVCSVLANAFMDAGNKVGMIFLEEGNKETLQRMVASKLKVNYLQFKRDPLSVASEEKIREVYDDICNNDRLILVDHFGSMQITSLMAKLKHMVLVEGCKYVVLDHVSAIISGLDIENERKALDVVMTEMASFCSANGVHLIVVTHINRTNSAQFLPPKGKEDEPFWVNVTKESARGSAALEQFSWNIIAVEPEIKPDFSRGRVRLKVLKTRFGDSLGIADVFTLDPNTWEVLLEEDGPEVF